jgi:subtilisin family serine protease
MRPVIEGDVPSFGRPARPREYVPGQVVVRVRPEAVRPHVAAPRMALSQSVADSLPDSIGEPVDYLRRNAGLKAVDPLFSPRLAQLRRSRLPPAARYRLAVAASVADVETDDLAGLAVASLPERRITGDLLETIGSSPGVEFAERLPTRWLEADGPDPKQNLQWGLRAIRYFDARRPSAADVRVAILDTGIDTTHPDLPDPVLYRHQGLRAQDIIGHGSHVAGIIAAIANNRIGITGIADCRLAVWKIFPDQPERGDFYVDSERYLRALGELPDEEVAAVNLSIGGAAHSQAEALLFRRLIERGVTPVAAMGNEYEEGNPTSYPAAYEDVVSVGAIAETRRRSRFSSTGRPHRPGGAGIQHPVHRADEAIRLPPGDRVRVVEWHVDGHPARHRGGGAAGGASGMVVGPDLPPAARQRGAAAGDAREPVDADLRSGPSGPQDGAKLSVA